MNYLLFIIGEVLLRRPQGAIKIEEIFTFTYGKYIVTILFIAQTSIDIQFENKLILKLLTQGRD